MAEHMLRERVAPEVVLCSSARRAQETLELISPALSDEMVLIEADLYMASARELLERLHQLPEATASAMLVGHNPAMQELALSLASPGSARAAIEGKYPTAGLAALSFEGSWSELDVGAAELVSFVTPKGLKPSG